MTRAKLLKDCYNETLYCVQHRNIQNLTIELYTGKNNLLTQIMSEMFKIRNVNYNLRTCKYADAWQNSCFFASKV